MSEMARTGFSRVMEELYHRLRGNPIPPRTCETCGVEFIEISHGGAGFYEPEPGEGQGSVTDGVATCLCCTGERGEARDAKRRNAQLKRDRHPGQPHRTDRWGEHLIEEPESIKEPQDEYEAMWYGAQEIRDIHDIDLETQWQQRQQGRYACYETGRFFDIERLEVVEVRKQNPLYHRRWRRLSPGAVGWQKEYNEWVRKDEQWPNPTVEDDIEEIRDEIERLEDIRPRKSRIE
jgi:hypothetical protein